VASTYFVVQRFELEKGAGAEFTARDHHSVQIVVAIEGAGVVEAEDCEPVHFAKGDAVVVPAAVLQFRIQAQPQLDFLKSFVPGVPVPEPEIISD
jgi:mannose-6-phosphate isomerase class I